MNSERIGVLDLADRSGVNKNTLKDWRTQTNPTLPAFEACLNAMGYRLVIKQIGGEEYETDL